MTTPSLEPQALLEKIRRLEVELQDAQLLLETCNGSPQEPNGLSPPLDPVDPPEAQEAGSKPNTTHTSTASFLHTLLLLADSALPLGSFAFSSGLESYLAHHPRSTAPQAHFRTFLDLSLQSLASTALPYVLSAHREPSKLLELDNDFDASTICNVARRASVAQGKALLGVWERAFKKEFAADGSGRNLEAVDALRVFTVAMKTELDEAYPPSAHLAPLWGVVTLALGLPLKSSAYLYLFSHARTVVSAAVRASVLGPYQAQSVLAAQALRDMIEGLVREHWDWKTEDAGQTVPIMDLWIGRHELLYSRIFNS